VFSFISEPNSIFENTYRPFLLTWNEGAHHESAEDVEGSAPAQTQAVYRADEI
jgi:hypothetical protein